MWLDSIFLLGHASRMALASAWRCLCGWDVLPSGLSFLICKIMGLGLWRETAALPTHCSR